MSWEERTMKKVEKTRQYLADLPLETLKGYKPTPAEVSYHKGHDPKEDRFDDCPLCYADVVDEDQLGWLMDRARYQLSNSIADTMGMRPLEDQPSDEEVEIINELRAALRELEDPMDVAFKLLEHWDQIIKAKGD